MVFEKYFIIYTKLSHDDPGVKINLSNRKLTRTIISKYVVP